MDDIKSMENAITTPECDHLVVQSSPEPGVRLLALNRISKRNALSQSLIQQLLNALAFAAEDIATRVVVISGSSTLFSAGADLQDIAKLGLEDARRVRYLEDLCIGMDTFKKPIIAAVEGIAAGLGGGFELALMCDMIIASEEARFGFPEVNVGLIPGAGGTQRLTSTIGKFKASKLILTGESISAGEAFALGIASQLSTAGHARDDAIALGATIASKSSSTCLLAKEAIQRAEKKSLDLEYERSLYYWAFGSADKREGVGAFLEKRAPMWARTE